MSHIMVIFGASGDLTSRKLVPALYALFQKNKLPAGTRIVGVARTGYSDDAWRESLAEATARFTPNQYDAETFRRFSQSIYYQPGDIESNEDFVRLAQRLAELEQSETSTRIYYLATAPSLYPKAIEQLGHAGLASGPGERRIVIEKPFGTDLRSARLLNEQVHRVFPESQVYRIDHYLGKETVQNILVLRFANSIFEPIWNRNYIDHVQITVAEEVDVGNRGAFYDSAGVLRDMFQNHLLQLLMITAMEAPVRFEADLVRDEKVKVLRAIRRMAGADFARDTVRGQYEGYRRAKGVQPDSQTATFAAIKLHIDNWRWKGVPFYLRSGKAMSCRTTQIVIEFHEPPHLMFQVPASGHVEPNRLIIQIQPAEGIQLHFQSKTPDANMRLRNASLEYRFRPDDSGEIPDAYQRLLLDALNGDASLFARSDEVELAWGIIDPILAAWQSPAAPPLESYPPWQLGAGIFRAMDGRAGAAVVQRLPGFAWLMAHRLGNMGPPVARQRSGAGAYTGGCA
ncbi:MAG: glucose-6-phosphate 1-dehydrogenase [Pirellulaceae bacterium]|nr:MAG: glucose-6-phosphate 1-dehydrogenase [Pirellulaceae bacterium]